MACKYVCVTHRQLSSCSSISGNLRSNFQFWDDKKTHRTAQNSMIQLKSKFRALKLQYKLIEELWLEKTCVWAASCQEGCSAGNCQEEWWGNGNGDQQDSEVTHRAPWGWQGLKVREPPSNWRERFPDLAVQSHGWPHLVLTSQSCFKYVVVLSNSRGPFWLIAPQFCSSHYTLEIPIIVAVLPKLWVPLVVVWEQN